MQPEPISADISSDRVADQGVQHTDPANLDVLNELIKREPIFHRSELGTTRQDLENMTVETFWEVGASGRRYSRKYVVTTLTANRSTTLAGVPRRFRWTRSNCGTHSHMKIFGKQKIFIV